MKNKTNWVESFLHERAAQTAAEVAVLCKLSPVTVGKIIGDLVHHGRALRANPDRLPCLYLRCSPKVPEVPAIEAPCLPYIPMTTTQHAMRHARASVWALGAMAH